MKTGDLKNIENCVMVRTLKKNTILHFTKMTSKYVYLLNEGYIKIVTTNEEGKEVIKYLVKPGNLFGELSLLDSTEQTEDYAVAVEDCEIGLIDKEKLKICMRTDDELRTEINRQIGSRIRKAENRLLAIIFRDAFNRICDFIVEFALEFGNANNETYEVKNILTHDDIAKLTATSRQTVSTVLNEMREKKQIEYNSDILRIPSSSELWKKKSGS
jgi:CRP/FNR family transcriptional regulator